MLILGAGAMSVGCRAEGGHEEPGLGEAGGPGVGGVHKVAFRPRPWPHTAQDPERRRRQRWRWRRRFPIWRRALTSPEDVAAPTRGGAGVPEAARARGVAGRLPPRRTAGFPAVLVSLWPGT